MLDVMAWVSSWATPAAALLGRGKDGGGGGMQGRYSQIPKKYDWLRPSTSSRVNFVDLDEMDRPETAGQIPSMMGLALPVAKNSEVKAWEERVRARAAKVDARSGATLADVRREQAASGAPPPSPVGSRRGPRPGR